MRKTKLIAVNIVEILLLLIAIWALTPFVKNNINQLYAVILGIICLVIILSSGGILNKNVLLIVILMFFVLMYKLVGVSDETIAAHSNMFLYFVTMISSIYLTKKLPVKRRVRFGALILLILILNVIQEIGIYFMLGSQSLYSTENLLSQGYAVGSTSFVAVVMLMSMLMTSIFFFDVMKKSKVLCVVMVLLGFFFVFYVVTRATALIFMIIFVISCVALGVHKRTSVKSVFLFITVFAVTLAVFPILLRFVINSGPEYFARKFSIIELFLNGSVAVSEDSMVESSFITRLYVAGVSLKTWFSSTAVFFFGKGYDAGFYMISGIGKHSELIDLFPKYGLVGVTLFSITFAGYFKYIKSRLNVKKPYLMIVAFFIIYSVFNGVFQFDIGVFMNLTIPFILSGFKMTEKGKIVFAYNR